MSKLDITQLKRGYFISSKYFKVMSKIPNDWDSYHLAMKHSHGKSLVNGGFNRKILDQWAIFHGYVKEPKGTNPCKKDIECKEVWTATV